MEDLSATAGHREAADRQRRRLQLSLAVLWLVDAMLQCQSFMFTRGFARDAGSNCPGQPGHHHRAWQLEHRLDRAASGGSQFEVAFPAARAVGATVSRATWLALWGGLAWLAARSASLTPRTLPDTISALAAGQPWWLADADRAAARLVVSYGTPVTITLATLLAIVAFGVFLPRPAARAVLTAAVVIALVSWVIGQDLGGICTGMGTDPSSGPLLVLLAAAYWPASLAALPGPAWGPEAGRAGTAGPVQCEAPARFLPLEWRKARPHDSSEVAA